MKYLTAILCTAMICATAIYCAHNWPGRYTYHGESFKMIDGMTGRIYWLFGNDPLTIRDPVAESKKVFWGADAVPVKNTEKLKPWEEYQRADKPFDPDAFLSQPDRTKPQKSGVTFLDDPFKLPDGFTLDEEPKK